VTPTVLCDFEGLMPESRWLHVLQVPKYVQIVIKIMPHHIMKTHCTAKVSYEKIGYGALLELEKFLITPQSSPCKKQKKTPG
jgi:hypothetical protein